jgi:acyl carrier protein
MQTKLNILLRRNLEESVYQQIFENYEKWKDLSLLELGIDSLSYMGLLVDLESNYNLSIDDIETINSLSSIETLLNRG